VSAKWPGISFSEFQKCIDNKNGGKKEKGNYLVEITVG
jgi:hypothetical protein